MYKLSNEGGECEILLYSLIEGGLTAGNVISRLQESTEPIKKVVLRINSDGGDIFEALTIYNYLKGLDAEVVVYVDGLAASAASLIMCAGYVYMADNAMVMIHNPLAGMKGTSEELRGTAEVLDKLKDIAAGIYSEKSGKAKEEVIAAMDSGLWMTATEAKAFGLCDEIVAHKEEAKPEDAVTMERERLRELDMLMTPERQGLIMKAKYETLQSASDIALELLRIESRARDNAAMEGITAMRVTDEDKGLSYAIENINRRRGYSNGGK